MIDEQIGKAENRRQRIIDFVRHARNELSDGRHLLGVHELGLQHGGIGDVGHHHDHRSDLVILVAHGAEIDGELADVSVAKKNRKLEIVDLMAGKSGVQRFFQKLATPGGDEVRQFTTEQFFLR